MANLAKIVASIGDAGLVASLGMHLFRDRGQPGQPTSAPAPGTRQATPAPAFLEQKENEHSTPFQRFQERFQAST